MQSKPVGRLYTVEIPSIETAERILHSPSLERSEYPFLVEIELSHQITVPTRVLPAKLIAALKRVATFANPKFFELQRLRFSTWKTPKYIFCGELDGDSLILPRGCLESVLSIFQKANAEVKIVDLRSIGTPIRKKFSGELRSSQKKAVQDILKSELGILVADPGMGKTVMACAVISKRKTSTLILVHRKPLIDQWKKELEKFLGLNPKSIGVIAKSKTLQSEIGIAMIQSLKNHDLQALSTYYGQVIIDECHHIAAYTFEAILKQFKAKYILGLTATPYRKDGLHPILHFQCGEIKHTLIQGDSLYTKKLFIRETFIKSVSEKPLELFEYWELITQDAARNTLICKDIIQAYKDHR